MVEFLSQAFLLSEMKLDVMTKDETNSKITKDTDEIDSDIDEIF